MGTGYVDIFDKPESGKVVEEKKGLEDQERPGDERKEERRSEEVKVQEVELEENAEDSG